MDSLSQFALGAGIGVAVMGRRTRVWKAALWGGLWGTVPDLDALIDHGDPIRNMTFHRGASHSLLYLTLLSPLLARTPHPTAAIALYSYRPEPHLDALSHAAPGCQPVAP